jgi:hypothetical protein
LTSVNPFGYIKAGHIKPRGFCKEIWCKSSHGLPPYNDQYLKLVLGIFDTSALLIEIGYRDLPDEEENVERCTAMAISQRLEQATRHGDSIPVIYFLLIEPTGDESNQYRRIGIGHTVDRLLGSILSGSTFADYEPQTITVG